MTKVMRRSHLPLWQCLSRSDPSARQLRTAGVDTELDQPPLTEALHGFGQRDLSGVVAGGANAITVKHYFRMPVCHQPTVVAGQDFGPRHVNRALLLAVLAITDTKAKDGSLEQ